MDRLIERLQPTLRVSAWVGLAFIVFATIGPAGLRPVTGFSPQIERFAAFGLVGALFAAAYPRHILLAALIVIGAAVLLEVLQLFEPSRHGRLFDMSVKIAGGIAGLVAGWLVSRLAPRRWRSST